MRTFIGFVLGVLMTLAAGVALLWFDQPAAPAAPMTAANGPAADAPSVTLTFSEMYLQQQASAVVAGQSDFRDLSVEVQPPDVVRLSGETTLLPPIVVRPTVSLQLHVVEGRVAVTALGTQLSNLTVPPAFAKDFSAAVAQQLETELNRQLQPLLEGGNLRLLNLRVTDDRIIVEAG